MTNFKKTTNGFNYVYENRLTAGETIVLKMPVVSSNKRSINDIGWQTDGDVTLYGTLCEWPENNNTLWTEIKDGDEVNKTVSAVKIVNGDHDCNIIIRVILN